MVAVGRRWLFPISLVVLLVGWEASVRTGMISDIILAPPTEVFTRLVSMTGDLVRGGPMLGHLLVTLGEVMLGFVLSIVIGVALGVMVAESRVLDAIITPYVVAFNASPKVAFTPLFISWFGFGMASKVAIAAFIAFFPLFTNVVAGLKAVEADQLELMRALRARRSKEFLRLKIPHALPYFFAGLRTAIVLSVIGAIVGEFTGASRGLGAFIKLASNELRIAQVFAAIIWLSVVGIILYKLVELVERRVIHWRQPDATTSAGL